MDTMNVTGIRLLSLIFVLVSDRLFFFTTVSTSIQVAFVQGFYLNYHQQGERETHDRGDKKK